MWLAPAFHHGPRPLVSVAIVDIVSAFRKVSTRSDQGRELPSYWVDGARLNELTVPASGPPGGGG